ncbi:MAG: MarR family winged helix-turn-helix transcriptional regulator, partial [Aristaeellaceae bacterium]
MSHPLLTIRLAIKRLYDHEMAPIMERYALTRMELDVLLFLGSNPGCDTAAQIVQLRMMTKSHISKAVEHLTEQGFLTQARDEQNRRRIHLTLTDAAQPVVSEAQQAQSRVITQMMAGVTPEE